MIKAKKKKGVIDTFFLWVNFILITALLISYLAPYEDPRKMWLIAFFGLAYPLLLLFNILLVIFWLFRKKWYAILSVAAVLCGWQMLNNNIGFRKAGNPEEMKDSSAIRVLTYNVHEFLKYGTKQSTKPDILTLIKQQDPDIVGIQEYYSRNRGKNDMTDSIKKIMQTKDYYVFSMNVPSPQLQALGIAIFSKFPILSRGFIQLSDMNSVNQCIYVDIAKGNRKFRYYSVHLQSIRFDPEDYKYLDSADKGKTDMRSTKRLGSKLKSAFIKRSEQVIKVKNDAANCPYPYVIAGDFNDTPSSYAVNQMAAGLKDAFHEKGSGFGRTYNGNFPNLQIDYIMASPQFEVSNYVILHKKLSDHFPVRSDLILK